VSVVMCASVVAASAVDRRWLAAAAIVSCSKILPPRLLSPAMNERSAPARRGDEASDRDVVGQS